MKVSKGQSQPEIVAAAFLIRYMVLGRPFYYRVLIVTQLILARGKQSWGVYHQHAWLFIQAPTRPGTWLGTWLTWVEWSGCPRPMPG